MATFLQTQKGEFINLANIDEIGFSSKEGVLITYRIGDGQGYTPVFFEEGADHALKSRQLTLALVGVESGLVFFQKDGAIATQKHASASVLVPFPVGPRQPNVVFGP